MTHEELVVSKFDESVPKLLQRDILRSVLACYAQADKHVKRNYPPPEAMTLRGWIRRADLEVDIRSVAAKYVGADAKPEPNKTNSIFHSVVVVGAVKLIQSKLPNPNRVVKRTSFSEEYAEESAQYLFTFMGKKRQRKVIPIEDREYLFAVLIHGCSPKDKSRPYFVRFAFPNKECSAWITKIDLMQRFPDVVSDFYAPINAAEAEQRRVKLKKGIRKGGREKQA